MNENNEDKKVEMPGDTLPDVRSDHVRVVLPDEIIQPTPTPENPDKWEIDLSKSRKYIKKLLDRDFQEVWKEINDQLAVTMLAMGDAALKWLEVWTNAEDPKLREEAKHHFVTLEREAKNLAERRQDLAKATGLNLNGEVHLIAEGEQANLPALYTPQPMSKEDFEKQFMQHIPKPVIKDMRDIPIKVTSNKDE